MSMTIFILAAVLATNGVETAAIGSTNATIVAHISSDVTYYDRKEGLAVFKGHVFVKDDDYQLATDRAYVFMTPSNTLSRIAATGSVAVTNGLRRAYGEKATYHRDNGLVVLHGSEGRPARVIDEAEAGAREARGRKIRFWINQEQLEIVEADLSAPRKGGEAASALGLPQPGAH